jgi:uncharacterized protein with PIN domain/sulfur carrier protein ThiS
MATARFRFHEPLSAFLRREHRGHPFSYGCARAATLKNAIEALGVPHTEAGSITVNGAPATLQRIVREGDDVEVHPVSVAPESSLFLADAHLGGLARLLRMLGFDTLHDQALHDDDIRRLACEQERVVLTRDRELLKCSDIARGCYVRALRPQEQLRQVAARYGLAGRARPFTLCLLCNLPLEPVAKAAVAPRVPAKVLAVQDAFARCARCGRIYWPGSHYARMKAALESAISPRRAPPPPGSGR